ncbi:MAG: hypothetical protein JWM21_2544 [Acidobacteria bacterium]|nr:hypothetical protein [Acidobacteriota bacterium]
MYIHDGSKRVVDDTYSDDTYSDDTYSDVYLNGERLSRAELIERMISRTIINPFLIVSIAALAITKIS